MRAVLMTAVGRPDVLKLAEVPEPEITGEHDAKMRLHAAGINPADYKLRASGTAKPCSQCRSRVPRSGRAKGARHD